MAFPIDWAAVEKEAVELLSAYLRIDTTNPPGNETAGALFLQKIFEREGVASEVIEPVAGRGSLVSRLAKNTDAAEVLLLHHIDVVPAEPGSWRHPPFSGAVISGEIWGRGAVDCKSLGIIELLAFLLLKREGLEPEKKLLYAATADEEIGGTCGVQELLRRCPEKLRARHVINEGVGLGFSNDRYNVYLCQVAEKAACWVKITFTGRPGHASVPHDENCVIDMAKAVQALAAHRFPVKITAPMEAFLRGFGAVQRFIPEADCAGLLYPDRCEAVLKRIPDPVLRRVIGSLVRNTAVPTVVSGGGKTNVIPGRCFCEIDCRILPGEDPEELKRTISSILDGQGCRSYSLEMNGSVASASPFNTRLFRAMQDSFGLHDPRAHLLPYMSPGATDSRFFRHLGIPCYGLQMDASTESAELIHGHNERIATGSLTFGIQVLHTALKTFCFP